MASTGSPDAADATDASGTTGSTVISMRIDAGLLERLRAHAAKRDMSVQDYIVHTLIRDDFDQRLMSAREETRRHYGAGAIP